MDISIGIVDTGAALRACRSFADVLNEIAAYHSEFELFHEGERVSDSVLQSVRVSDACEIFLTKEDAWGQKYGVLEAFIGEDGERRHIASIYIDGERHDANGGSGSPR